MASTTALSRKDKQVLQEFDNSVRGMPHFIIHLALYFGEIKLGS